MGASGIIPSEGRAASAAPGPALAAEPVLVGEELGKVYRRSSSSGEEEIVALSGVSISLRRGEVACIVGRSGQGKTSLLRILALDDEPTSGRLVVLGRDVAQLSRSQRDDLRGEAIHYVPQRHLGLLPRTAVDTVAYWLVRLDGLSPLDAEARAMLALEAVGLPHRKFTQRVDRGFSGGEGARVALATAFARGRPICLADEVFAGLDIESALPLISLFRELARRGASVAVIVHQPELWPYFDRVVTIDDKRLVSDAVNPEPLLAGHALLDLEFSGSEATGSIVCDNCAQLSPDIELYCRACFAPLHGTAACPCGRRMLPIGAAFCTGWRCRRRL